MRAGRCVIGYLGLSPNKLNRVYKDNFIDHNNEPRLTSHGLCLCADRCADLCANLCGVSAWHINHMNHE